MARIGGSSEEGTYRITQWYGLNESPDGDTKLKLGEAADMRNWRITRDRNLQRRPGNSMVKGLLQGYDVAIAESNVVIREDENRPSTLVMYPNVTALYDGFLQLYGTSANVSYENIATHTGWYWRRGKYKFYRVDSCTYDEDRNVYVWKGARLEAESDTENADFNVRGMWSGTINGKEYVLAACNGHLWNIWNDDTFEYVKQDLGELDTSNRVNFFPFSGIVYILNGHTYMQYDGIKLQPVVGYRPLISTANTPSGGGTLLEEVNKLNGMRRVWFSPNGTSTEFQLPETDLMSIDYVKTTADDAYVDPTTYTVDIYNGKVTFNTAPVSDTNTIEIGYTAPALGRAEVDKMTNAEIFLGSVDNAVFLYGNGTNEAFYSGVDYLGKPRADYFPDLNEMAVADANTPITAMVRHMSKLLVFKESSTYAVQYGLISLADGSEEYAFYVTPINRILGNVPMGQVRIVLNSPMSLCGNDLYEWKSSSRSVNISSDERNAVRKSDRVYSTLESFDIKNCFCYDDNFGQEYYICCNKEALVYNYAVDAWYRYTDFDAVSMINFNGYILYGTSDGMVECLSYNYKTSNGEAIDSYWESGSMDFGREYQRKYSAQMWVGIKPESSGEVSVTVQTDKKSEYSEKIVSSDLFDFGHVNFSRLSFKTNRKPQIKRLKLKAKKFVYYKLVFKTDRADTSATITATDIRVRFTGTAK